MCLGPTWHHHCVQRFDHLSMGCDAGMQGRRFT